MFANRETAGQQLARAVVALAPDKPVILALPRGGVPVAAPIASLLHAPLDLVLVRKIGAPRQPELAVGAVVDGATPQTILNDEIVQFYNVGEDYIRSEAARQIAVIEARRRSYLKERAPIPLAGRTAIIVDDGIATGATVRAAILAIRLQNPARVILAVPVGAPETLEALRAEVDDLICLEAPAFFSGVGMHYEDFSQTEDSEVIALLDQAAARGNPT